MSAVGRLCTIAVIASLAARCGDVNAALGKLGEAAGYRRDSPIEFTKAADAANRAVMADTDAMSVGHDAAKQSRRFKDADALAPILQLLGYAEETRLLHEFTTHLPSTTCSTAAFSNSRLKR